MLVNFSSLKAVFEPSEAQVWFDLLPDLIFDHIVYNSKQIQNLLVLFIFKWPLLKQWFIL